MSGLLSGNGGNDTGIEGRDRGSRRKKLAGYLTAANEIRQSYQASAAERWRGQDDLELDDSTIPGSFPDVAIVSHGDEQLILFPSYARNHTKEEPNPDAPKARDNDSDSSGDAEYWAREWQRFENDTAIVDVDVKGWIYSPHRGPISRKNRVLIGLARKLSGIPAPKTPDRSTSPSLISGHNEREAQRDQENIAREAEKILKRGTEEEKFAARGAYSEKPKDDSDDESVRNQRGRTSRTPSLADPPGPGYLAKRGSWNHPDDMSPSELLAANAHLMARIKPFMTNPLVSTPVTIFFYDEKKSVSRTVKTNESGHFVLRAALDFIPTHIRVLASEHLSATEEVKVTQPKGVSVISDVDDTIKHSSIGSGAREIFRNAFIRDLGDLTIEGVKEWYNTMYDMGVGFHFVSNSPWQLFPVLVSFFQIAGLPPGSYHLKQYSGMLQGIFEPVAERKKGTLTKIMRDFPERRFILIGDSGEADLEVYTDIALAHPGMILAIFIRDVTTPENSFFDSAMGPLSGDRSKARNTPGRSFSADEVDVPESRPTLPPRIMTEVSPQTSTGPAIGQLIDFEDEPEEMNVHESHRRVMPRSASDLETITAPRVKSATDLGIRAPPPRPVKPAALRSLSKPGEVSALGNQRRTPPPAPPSRRPLSAHVHPLSQSVNAADSKGYKEANEGYVASAKQKVSDVYNALPEVRSRLPGRMNSDNSSLDSSEQAAPTPPRRNVTSRTANAGKRMSWNSTDTSDDESNNLPVNKKFDLWKRRWKRAKDILDAQGVTLRTWRTGSDVAHEAVQLIEKTMTSMNVEGYGKDAGKGKTGEGGGEMKAKDMKRPTGDGTGKMKTKDMNPDHQ